MKRIPFFLLFIFFSLNAFCQNKNIVFRENYKASQIEQIKISLITENLFISQINGDEIVVEIGTNNKNTMPEVKVEQNIPQEQRGQTPLLSQNQISLETKQNFPQGLSPLSLLITQTNSEFSKGDLCNVYVYVPAKYTTQNWIINTSYGNINADGLFAETSVLVTSGNGSCKLNNVKTEYFSLQIDAENKGSDISKLSCSYFDLKGFVGPIHVSLSQAPQAKSLIRTKTGAITLTIPKTENFEISARSNKSSFVNNYLKTKKAAPDWVNYTSNQGGPLIQLQTFEGEITIGE